MNYQNLEKAFLQGDDNEAVELSPKSALALQLKSSFNFYTLDPLKTIERPSSSSA